MMEDQIIVAVCGKPELYDSTNYFYRDKYRKDLAWRRVSEEPGVADRWTGVHSGGRFVSQRGTADLRTGSWTDGSTAEIDHHPDAAPGVCGGILLTVPVPEESREPRDVNVGGVFGSPQVKHRN
ncbi:hypothetical protein CHARACLAT_031889 [Characodon lateralis]|uniref:MHC class I antigen n=1 Tax=Characodon lateralis TaxID=208331 RepID=A0ABU7D6J7_9TELE|nr:hypothetical protein [Characodon lateralis]